MCDHNKNWKVKLLVIFVFVNKTCVSIFDDVGDVG